jgi:MSHA biogenesis protein MshI
MGWFNKAKRENGWLAISVTATEGIAGAELSFVHGRSVPGGKPELIQYSIQSAAEGEGEALETAARELGVGQYDCATLLKPGDYQILLVEAPAVPREELKTAIRWRLKDMLDYHVDDATVDVLDIPVPKDAPTRSHSMYAVTAKNETIQRCIARFESAKIALSVIDIPETAQRNIAGLYEPRDRGVALLYFDNSGGLLTITYKGELYLARRIEITPSQLASESHADQEETRGRVLLELQRSFDHFDRQFGHIAISRLLLGPEPVETGLREYLGQSLGLPVESIDLNAVVSIPGDPIGQETQWRLFHLLGASLRSETRVL